MMSPGLVVVGGDSCSKGREFESRYAHFLDDELHFDHLVIGRSESASK